MDGDDGLDASVKFTARETLLEIDGDESGLPVVAVDEVRSEIKDGK